MVVWWWEKARRGVRTVYFVVAMVSSLLVVVAIGDAVLPCLLIPSFTCVKCYSFREHLERYAFKSRLWIFLLFPSLDLSSSYVYIRCVMAQHCRTGPI